VTDGTGSGRIRLGVIGAGQLSQLVHLPNVARLSELFELCALADPSARRIEALGRRYRIPRVHADPRALIEQGGLDAVMVLSPNVTHAGLCVAALEAGCHVFVEKPLALTLADVDRVVEARDRTGKLVQVGYMKRYSGAYRRLRRALAAETGALRLISSHTVEPDLVSGYPLSGYVPGDDMPSDLLDRARAELERQTASALGAAPRDPAACYAFSEIFLGSLIHSVNLGGGLLDVLPGQRPPAVETASWWAGGKAAHVVVRLAGGCRWTITWTEATDAGTHEELTTVVFDDAVHRLRARAPYLRHEPATLSTSTRDGEASTRSISRSEQDPFVAELEHFAACIAGSADCETPPEQARADIALLTDAFQRATPGAG
jgi:predicted dehydrogenase